MGILEVALRFWAMVQRKKIHDLKDEENIDSICRSSSRKCMKENTAPAWEGCRGRSAQIQLEHSISVMFRKEVSDKGSLQ